MENTARDDLPLDELMVAMDVVDTLRHQQSMVDRELDDDARRERLLERLRELYSAQGIDVPDHVLQKGIKALEEERFQYIPVEKSLSTRLARFWIKRKKWSKPVGFLALMAAFVLGDHLLNDVMPERAARSELPSSLLNTLSDIKGLAKDPLVIEEATVQYESAKASLRDEKISAAKELGGDLEATLEQLRQEYTIRVTSYPNEMSGLWRVPDVNESGRNYYLIVEAVDRRGKLISLPVLSEETGKRTTVKKWGLRVDEKTFYAIADDKKDDGIIQGAELGKKMRGYMHPRFSVATSGSAITRW